MTQDIRQLNDLRSIGPAALKDFEILGITSVAQLKKADAIDLYEALCRLTSARHDPCVKDVFQCAIAQARDPKLSIERTNWWYWSRVRKQGEP